MAALVYEHAGLRTYYDAETGRLVTFDDAIKRQHRTSGSAFPDLPSAKNAFLENRIHWDDWATGWPELK